MHVYHSNFLIIFFNFDSDYILLFLICGRERTMCVEPRSNYILFYTCLNNPVARKVTELINISPRVR